MKESQSPYAQQMTAARSSNSVLFLQVQRAALIAANAISNEAKPTGVDATPEALERYEKRQAWAHEMRFGTLSTSQEHAVRMIPLILENPTIAAGQVVPVDGQGNPTGEAPGSPDGDIQFVMNAIVDIYLDK